MDLAPTFLKQETEQSAIRILNIFSIASLVNCYIKYGSCPSELINTALQYFIKTTHPTLSFIHTTFENITSSSSLNWSIQHSEYKAGQLKIKTVLNSHPDLHSHFKWAQLHPEWNWEYVPSWEFGCAFWLYNRRPGWYDQLKASQARSTGTGWKQQHAVQVQPSAVCLGQKTH